MNRYSFFAALILAFLLFTGAYEFPVWVVVAALFFPAITSVTLVVLYLLALGVILVGGMAIMSLLMVGDWAWEAFRGPRKPRNKLPEG